MRTAQFAHNAVAHQSAVSFMLGIWELAPLALCAFAEEMHGKYIELLYFHLRAEGTTRNMFSIQENLFLDITSIDLIIKKKLLDTNRLISHSNNLLYPLH